MRLLLIVFTLMACTATEPACVDACPEGSTQIGSRCGTNADNCVDYETCSGGRVSCSSTCTSTQSCPAGTANVGTTDAILPRILKTPISLCGGVMYCAPCVVEPFCPSGEVPVYTGDDFALFYDCDMGRGFECIPLEECLVCIDPTSEVESCEPEANCSERICGDTVIACEVWPSCEDACESATSPLLRSNDGPCPEDATHCVEPLCQGAGVYCETACHPEGRSVASVDLCGEETCNFVDIDGERVWCAGEPFSCRAIPSCEDGDATIERDAPCTDGMDCYYRAACGQVIQCESSI